MRLKKRYGVIAVLLVIIVVGLIIYNRSRTSNDKFVTEVIKKGNLLQIVSATGTIIPPSEINLNNLITGKLVEINVDVGDEVKKGDILAKLDGKDLEIKLKEAEANLSGARADLNRLLAGAKNEDVAVSAINVDKAKDDYDNALKTLENTKEQSAHDIKASEDNLDNVKKKTEKDIDVADEAVKLYTNSLENIKITKSQAIENNKENALTDVETKSFVAKASLNVVYDILNDSDMGNVISVKDISYISKTEDYYDSSEIKINDARMALTNADLDKNFEKIKDALDKANSALNETFNTLLSCYNVLLNTITGGDLSKTALDAHKASIKAEQVNISAALGIIQSDKQSLDIAELDYTSSIDTAKNNLTSAKVNLELAKTTQATKISDAENNLFSTRISSQKRISDQDALVDSYYNNWKLMERQLDLKKSSPLGSEINLYNSRIQQSEAARDAVKENFEKTILLAPTSGIITKKNYEIGEQTNLNIPVFLMISINSYEIEVTIPESDIVKVKTGQNVKVTLDAYSDDIEFTGEVIFIEPAETMIQDVVYYKVKITLDECEYAIKSGMTANVDIETAKRENILMIPQRAVLGGNGNRTVKRLIGEVVDEVKVVIGLKGEDGMVELLNGDLKKGDTVVVFERK